MHQMIYFPNDETLLTQYRLCSHQRLFFRFTFLLVGNDENTILFLPKKFPLDGNEMLPIIAQTSVFAGKEN